MRPPVVQHIASVAIIAHCVTRSLGTVLPLHRKLSCNMSPHVRSCALCVCVGRVVEQFRMIRTGSFLCLLESKMGVHTCFYSAAVLTAQSFYTHTKKDKLDNEVSGNN